LVDGAVVGDEPVFARAAAEDVAAVAPDDPVVADIDVVAAVAVEVVGAALAADLFVAAAADDEVGGKRKRCAAPDTARPRRLPCRRTGAGP